MAASTRGICGCTTSLLLKAVVNFRSFVHCNEKFLADSFSKSRFLCVESPVVVPRKALSVTSISQRDRTFPFDGQARLTRFEQITRTLFNAAHCSQLSPCIALNKDLPPYKHTLWQRPCVFSSRGLASRKSCGQSESGTESPYPKQHANMFSSRSDSSAGRDQIHDRTASGSEKLEKKENIKTIPNLLTTLRMASAPLLGYMVVCESFGLALGLFTFAGFTDLLDGYIARNFPNQTSALGSALDPLADKLLVTILTVTLTTVGLIPIPLTGLIVFRDASLIAGGFYIRYKSLPPPITLSRYFDISYATVSLAPTFISKVNTGLQLSLVAVSLAAPVFGFVDHVGLHILWWTTGATTFLSGADYLWSWKKYVTLLEKDQKEL